jgi:TniQ
MMPQAGLRELPIRVPITDGESLHSWIEALAARYRMTVREMLPALSLPGPRVPFALILGIGGQTLRSLEWQAGLPPGRLDHAVLERYSALGLAIAAERGQAGQRQSLWARGSGSGFCPRCLAESGGRWAVAWHLNWAFACTRHNVLMASQCPACGRRPRSGENRLDHVIDSQRCCHYDLESRPERHPSPALPRCGALLTEQPVHELGASHPLIACQKWINGVISEPARATVAGLHVPPKAALTAVAVLMRSAALTDGSFAGRRVTHLAVGPVTDGISLASLGPVGSAVGVYSTVANDPALFGTLATLAVDVLATPSLSTAAEAMSWMLADAGHRISPTGALWRRRLKAAATGSPVLDAIVLRQRATSMNAADRLSHRTENTVPRRPPASASASREGEWPFSPGRMTSVPARLVPQVAWRPVIAALSPHGLKDTGTLATVLSMAVVRSGTYAEWSHIATWLMLPPRFGRTPTAVLRSLEHTGHLEETLASIDALVEELTEHPPAIDYARRRWLFRDLDFVTPFRLRKACHADGLKLTERRIRYATMLLWETLTGGDVRFASKRISPLNMYDRAEYAEFRDSCGDSLREYIAVEGERLLLHRGIDEPVMWQPEPTGPAGHAWHSPPADLTRHLSGWEGRRKKGRLRRRAYDHTPRVASSRLPATFLAISRRVPTHQTLSSNRVAMPSLSVLSDPVR